MKRLILENSSKIHINDITINHKVMVVMKGEIMGFIYYEDNGWCYMQHAGYGQSWENFTDIIEDKFPNCEFYVLD